MTILNWGFQYELTFGAIYRTISFILFICLLLKKTQYLVLRRDLIYAVLNFK